MVMKRSDNINGLCLGYTTESEDLSDGEGRNEETGVRYPFCNDYSLLSVACQSPFTDALVMMYTEKTISDYAFGSDLYQLLMTFFTRPGLSAMEINNRRNHVHPLYVNALNMATRNQLRITEMIQDVFL